LGADLACFGNDETRRRTLCVVFGHQRSWNATRFGTISSERGHDDPVWQLQINAQVMKLTAQRKSILGELGGAKRDQPKVLKEQIEEIDDAIALDGEMNDALAKILNNSNLLGHAGLAGDIDRLQRTTPELMNGKVNSFAPPLDSLSGVASAGLTSQLSAMEEKMSQIVGRSPQK
jgi:hypothetical protein